VLPVLLEPLEARDRLEVWAIPDLQAQRVALDQQVQRAQLEPVDCPAQLEQPAQLVSLDPVVLRELPASLDLRAELVELDLLELQVCRNISETCC